MLHDYIREKAQRDWLFKKYNDEELIFIDNEDEAEDDELQNYTVPAPVR